MLVPYQLVILVSCNNPSTSWDKNTWDLSCLLWLNKRNWVNFRALQFLQSSICSMILHAPDLGMFGHMGLYCIEAEGPQTHKSSVQSPYSRPIHSVSSQTPSCHDTNTLPKASCVWLVHQHEFPQSRTNLRSTCGLSPERGMMWRRENVPLTFQISKPLFSPTLG